MSETQTSSDQPKPWGLSEAALLAAIPAYGFYLSFRYETGIANYYGYPNSFIIVSLENVFSATGALLAFICSLLVVINFISIFIPQNKQKYVNYFIPLIYSSLLLIIYLLTISINLKQFLFISFFILIVTGIIYIPPLFTRKKYGSYIASLEASEKSEEPIKSRSLFNRISQKIGRNNFLTIIVLIFLLPFIADLIGYRDAAKESSYLVFKKDVELVVLKIYGQTMVCAPFNRKERTFDRAFFLLPMTANPKTSFSPERIGSLLPKE